MGFYCCLLTSASELSQVLQVQIGAVNNLLASAEIGKGAAFTLNYCILRWPLICARWEEEQGSPMVE